MEGTYGQVTSFGVDQVIQVDSLKVTFLREGLRLLLGWVLNLSFVMWA